MDRLIAKYQFITRSRNFKLFMKFGAPMFVFTVGGSLLLVEFQRIRFNYKNDRHNQQLMNDILKDRAMKIDMKEEYEKIRQADTSNYQNVRGPRMYEDNAEFLRNRERQEKRMAELLGTSPTVPNTATSP